MAPRSITLVTYNVWFGSHFQAERTQALLRILRAANADIIGLQEVTPTLLAYLRGIEWIADGYEISPTTVSPYGAIIMTRIPRVVFTAHQLPTMMGRKLVMATFPGLDGLTVGTVHLESLRYAKIRRQQLINIFPILGVHPHAVLMGDFNMCSTWDENRNLDPKYTDIWPHLQPGEPGWTEDTDVNTMRLLVNSKRTQVRFDRVILRSTDNLWRPAEIQRLGMEPISDELPDVFPSDHFGLRAVLRRATSDAAPVAETVAEPVNDA